MTESVLTEVQWVSASSPVCDDDQISQWVRAAVDGGLKDAPRRTSLPGVGLVTVRIVDEEESAGLNSEYRDKPGPTNVLAFPCDPVIPAMDDADEAEFGDLLVCWPVVVRESAEQTKSQLAHFAHMVVHGTLHLLGYDHISDDEAGVMEQLETDILCGLGYSNPYQVSEGLNSHV